MQHGGKIFVTVLKQLDLVARDRDRVRKRQGGTEELRIADRESVIEAIFQGLAPDEKEAEDQNDRQEPQAKHDPLGESEFPPALVQPV